MKPTLTTIDGKIVTNAEKQVQMAAAQVLNDNVTKVQIVTGKLLKVLGQRVNTRVALSALAACVGKVFTLIPKDKHPAALAEFQNVLMFCVLNEYTPEEREVARQRSLAAQAAIQRAAQSTGNEETH